MKVLFMLVIVFLVSCTPIQTEKPANDNLSEVNFYLFENQKYSSFQCGFKPFPPLGCKIGRCICDSRGQNCYWETIC